MHKVTSRYDIQEYRSTILKIVLPIGIGSGHTPGDPGKASYDTRPTDGQTDSSYDYGRNCMLGLPKYECVHKIPGVLLTPI